MDCSSFINDLAFDKTEIRQDEGFDRVHNFNFGQLSRQLSEVSEMCRLADSKTVSAPGLVDALLVRRLIAANKVRASFLPAALFSDPVWNILLDLTAAMLEGKPVSTSSLCIAAEIPTTTALRCITSLVEQGLLKRQTDPKDARRTYILLSESTYKTMLACLAAMTVALSSALSPNRI